MRRPRLLLFGSAAAIVLVVDPLAVASINHFDTGLRFAGWWFVLPALLAAALVIRPVWGSAVAGVAAGGVIAISIDGNMMTSSGVNWSVGDLFTSVGLVGTVALLFARTVRIFPDARNEFASLVAQSDGSRPAREPDAPLSELGG